MLLETLIFSGLLLIALGMFLFTLKDMIDEDHPFQRRIRYAGDMRTAIEIAGEAALEAQKRREAPTYMKVVVDRLHLGRWFGTDGMRDRLAQAGYRFRGAEVIYLFLRFAAPIVMLLVVGVYVYVLGITQKSFALEIALIGLSAVTGFKLPDIYLGSKTTTRVQNIREFWPDSLDLMQIAVESGMTVEQAIRYVASHIEGASPALSDELQLLLVHFNVLPNKRAAYLQLAERVPLDTIANFATVMVQAEQSGTPTGKALRTLSDDCRQSRMREAETKAAKLGPKLTVPLILFFLPVLFIIIGTPAYIIASGVMK